MHRWQPAANLDKHLEALPRKGTIWKKNYRSRLKYPPNRPSAGFRFQTFASLRHLDYRYLWTGTLMMSAGQWIQQVTLGWLLYDLTGSSMLLGALNGLRTLPFLVTGPMAGVAADRMDRRKLLLQTQWVLIVTAVLMGALVASRFFCTYGTSLFSRLITGVAWTITEPVRMSMIPNVVPKEDFAERSGAQFRRFQL